MQLHWCFFSRVIAVANFCIIIFLGGGPHEILTLKPSEEALVTLGLLEQEAVEGLADIDDSEDPASASAG